MILVAAAQQRLGGASGLTLVAAEQQQLGGASGVILVAVPAQPAWLVEKDGAAVMTTSRLRCERHARTRAHARIRTREARA